MPNPIQTTGLTKNVTTYARPGETIPAWTGRHTTAVQASTPNANALTTSWTATSGVQAVTTAREPGESDEAFLTRHALDYTMMMIGAPPLP